jgi:hypothetical protein
MLFHTICRTGKTIVEYADNETEKIEIDKRFREEFCPSLHTAAVRTTS